MQNDKIFFLKQLDNLFKIYFIHKAVVSQGLVCPYTKFEILIKFQFEIKHDFHEIKHVISNKACESFNRKTTFTLMENHLCKIGIQNNLMLI